MFHIKVPISVDLEEDMFVVNVNQTEIWRRFSNKQCFNFVCVCVWILGCFVS